MKYIQDKSITIKNQSIGLADDCGTIVFSKTEHTDEIQKALGEKAFNTLNMFVKHDQSGFPIGILDTALELFDNCDSDNYNETVQAISKLFLLNTEEATDFVNAANNILFRRNLVNIVKMSIKGETKRFEGLIQVAYNVIDEFNSKSLISDYIPNVSFTIAELDVYKKMQSGYRLFSDKKTDSSVWLENYAGDKISFEFSVANSLFKKHLVKIDTSYKENQHSYCWIL